jgi:hypothetical protein
MHKPFILVPKQNKLFCSKLSTPWFKLYTIIPLLLGLSGVFDPEADQQLAGGQLTYQPPKQPGTRRNQVAKFHYSIIFLRLYTVGNKYSLD